MHQLRFLVIILPNDLWYTYIYTSISSKKYCYYFCYHYYYYFYYYIEIIVNSVPSRERCKYIIKAVNY